MEGLTGLCVLQLGTKLVDNAAVVGIKAAFDHYESMSIRLAKQVLCFVYLIRRVNRNQHRTDLSGRPEGNIPGGHVGRPDRHLTAALYAKRNKRAGKIVNVVAELAVGSGVIESCVLEGVLVGKFLDHAVKHLRKGLGNKLVLFPDELTRVGLVIIKSLFLSAG